MDQVVVDDVEETKAKTSPKPEKKEKASGGGLFSGVKKLFKGGSARGLSPRKQSKSKKSFVPPPP